MNLKEKENELGGIRYTELLAAGKEIDLYDVKKNIYLDVLRTEKKFSFGKIVNIFKQSHEDNIKHRGIVVELFEFAGGPIWFGVMLGFLSIMLTIIFPAISNIFQTILNNYFDGSFNTACKICLKIFLGTALIPSALSLLWPVFPYFFHLIKNTIIHLSNKEYIKDLIKEIERSKDQLSFQRAAAKLPSDLIEIVTKKYAEAQPIIGMARMEHPNGEKNDGKIAFGFNYVPGETMQPSGDCAQMEKCYFTRKREPPDGFF